MTSARAKQASYIVLPQDKNSFATVLDFLIQQFPHIDVNIWRERIRKGKVHWQNGELITEKTPLLSCARVYYYREVEHETKVPFKETILYQDDEIIIAHKPHFLPVTPSGHFVNECLIHRLRLKTGIETISPAHRLDRDTAGLVLLTLNPQTRHLYHELFSAKKIHKEYLAIANLTPELSSLYKNKKIKFPFHWTIKNAIRKSQPSFIMEIIDDVINSHSEIDLIDVKNNRGLFKLSPITGKTHQLRIHMNSLNMPILNDRFYPELLDKQPDNYEKPLQLESIRLKFIDPVTNIKHDFYHKNLALY